MLKMLFNTVDMGMERLFINENLYTLFSHPKNEFYVYTQFLPNLNNPLLTKLYTLFIDFSSVIYGFKHYSQGLYKLKLIKYI